MSDVGAGEGWANRDEDQSRLFGSLGQGLFFVSNFVPGVCVPGRLGSASSSSSCGSAEYSGEVIPHHPGYNKFHI